MRLKKLGAALVVVAALGAVLASSALAAAVTEDVKWYVGASPGTELTGSKTATAEQVGEGTFKTTVSGSEIVLHATGTECVECKIENSGGVAIGSGKLKFTGVTVEKPAHCTTSASITTNALSVTADWMKSIKIKEGELEITIDRNYVKFVPTAGEEAGFASFSLTGTECALKTTIIPKGSVFVRSVNLTGVQAATQEVESSGEINSEAGGSLHVGTEAATLAAKAKFSIGGEAFGTH